MSDTARAGRSAARSASPARSAGGRGLAEPARGADGGAPVRVEPYGGDRAEWDAFVLATASSTCFHRTAWLDTIERNFGYRRHDVVARRDGRIVGVLPLCEFGTFVTGRSLLSVPFAVEAGICAADPAARRALEQAAVAIGATRGAVSVELRDHAEAPEFRVREGVYCRFRRLLAARDAENLAAVPRKQRRMIRVAQRHGLRADPDRRHIAVFHDLYARTARRHGSPVFALRYFQTLLDAFGDDCLLLTAWRDDVPVAGVLSFFFRDTVLPYYAGSRRELSRYAGHDFLYWELMRAAVRRGVRWFDFGRSKLGTGAFAFKRHWGFEPEPLRYRVCTYGRSRPARSIEDAWVSPVRRAWSRLPLSLTKRLGPALVRRFGPYYT
jgi:FemAB-related protein (PEP-CTERM system-associated)